ncbi:cupin domain-containing protein [Salibacter sp.]|uniref:cupin domain-containing protein n=1 Tax=Salibacter sp. TaxID=2010995 RepID=UPI00287005C4|nr:cupin domain-containing protein [Salibacter sp.]MDR9487525.1 cupin domain-containing protein [Salibacter sp.]
MKQLFISVLLISIVKIGFGQFWKSAADIVPNEEYDNVHVQKMHTSEEVSSFVIWVKNEVKPHLHGNHVEHVYLIEGYGTMLLGDELKEVRAGDIIAIPPNVVHAVKTLSKIPLKVISIQSPEFFNKDRNFVELENWPPK